MFRIFNKSTEYSYSAGQQPIFWTKPMSLSKHMRLNWQL